jgi:Lon protease-like protein
MNVYNNSVQRYKPQGTIDLSELTIPLFPLSQALFPDSMMPLRIFEVRYLHMIKRCQRDKTPFGIIVLRQGSEVQKPGESESLHPVGCLAQITDVAEIQPGLLFIHCTGTERFRVLANERGAYGLWNARVSLMPADIATDIPPDLQPIADELGSLIAGAQRQGVEAQLPITRPYRLDECGWVANQWATLLDLDSNTKAALLAEEDALTRLTQVKLLIKPK